MSQRRDLGLGHRVFFRVVPFSFEFVSRVTLFFFFCMNLCTRIHLFLLFYFYFPIIILVFICRDVSIKVGPLLVNIG